MSAREQHPDHRPAIVTGASSGIGRATALALAAVGHPVVLGARRVERCQQVADEIIASGGAAVALPLDVCDAASVARFASAAEASVGSIEVLVSNAGNVSPMSVVGADPAAFAEQVAVNLLGPQALLHAVVPGMIERQRGDVVIVTSEVARLARPYMAGYVAAKTGLEGLITALQMELEGTGVRAGMVRPGPTTTEQGSTWSTEDITTVLDVWSRWGVLRHDGYLRPEDLAAAVLAMVSTPRGAHLRLIEVQPEAPIREVP